MRGFRLIWAGAAVVLSVCAGPGQAATPDQVRDVQHGWNRLVLELVRHTATYSPPVASRAFAYLGIAGYEALAGAEGGVQTLAGQVNGLTPLPARAPGAAYDEAVVMQATFAAMVPALFGNTGPSGQRAMAITTERMDARVAEGVAPDVLARSQALGAAVAAHVLDWSASDGGAVIANMGFPQDWTGGEGPSHWVPTSLVRQQQAPLLPGWGQNRSFAMADGAACPLPPPPDYSEDPGSAFYAEAREVYDTVNSLTDEQRLIARFWSDDPMLSPTPPGHWITIALDLLDAEPADPERSAEVLALLGITLADGFIGCWNAKYDHDLLRPVTYIKRVIDPKWEPILITPPFPEYPSGHSTQSGAAAVVLAHLFGADRAFDDATHVNEGLPLRSFPSFHAAAEEAGISRLYGGIHFRAGVERGLEQGRCIGDFTLGLKTRSAE